MIQVKLPQGYELTISVVLHPVTAGLRLVVPGVCCLSFPSPAQQLVTDGATAFSKGPLSSPGKRPLEFREEMLMVLLEHAALDRLHTPGESSKGTRTPATAANAPASGGETLAPCLESTEEERLEVKLERVLKYSQCMMAVAVGLNC